MSKLTITGRSKRKVEADYERITIRFQAHAESSAAASIKVISECESFLEELTQWGILLDWIHMSNDDINQEYDDMNVDAEATREIKIEMPYNMEFNNSIMELVQEKKMNVDFEISYYISNEEAIHNELLKEALADSKEKAELIASAEGQRIIGIDTAEMSNWYNSQDWLCCERERGFLMQNKREPKISDHLKAPINEVSESIEVVWIMSS